MTRLLIERIEQIQGYGLVVHFTDQTTTTFTVEELANLHHHRLEMEAKRNLLIH